MAYNLKLKATRALKRRMRVRGKIRGTAEIPRMTVAKSLKNNSFRSSTIFISRRWSAWLLIQKRWPEN